jgi:hypothetical protein
MEIASEDILKICDTISGNHTIMSVHLSDMGIIDDLALEVLEAF